MEARSWVLRFWIPINNKPPSNSSSSCLLMITVCGDSPELETLRVLESVLSGKMLSSGSWSKKEYSIEGLDVVNSNFKSSKVSMRKSKKRVNKIEEYSQFQGRNISKKRERRLLFENFHLIMKELVVHNLRQRNLRCISIV